MVIMTFLDNFFTDYDVIEAILPFLQNLDRLSKISKELSYVELSSELKNSTIFSIDLEYFLPKHRYRLLLGQCDRK